MCGESVGLRVQVTGVRCASYRWAGGPQPPARIGRLRPAPRGAGGATTPAIDGRACRVPHPVLIGWKKTCLVARLDTAPNEFDLETVGLDSTRVHTHTHRPLRCGLYGSGFLSSPPCWLRAAAAAAAVAAGWPFLFSSLADSGHGKVVSWSSSRRWPRLTLGAVSAVINPRGIVDAATSLADGSHPRLRKRRPRRP